MTKPSCYELRTQHYLVPFISGNRSLSCQRHRAVFNTIQSRVELPETALHTLQNNFRPLVHDLATRSLEHIGRSLFRWDRGQLVEFLCHPDILSNCALVYRRSRRVGIILDSIVAATKRHHTLSLSNN